MKLRRPTSAGTMFAAFSMVFATFDALADRVDEIRARGHMTCGIATHVAGFTATHDDGSVSGFEPDFCRAVAAAILGRDGQVEFVPADSIELFVASGQPDLVARRLTLTLRRSLEPGISFSPIVFYDGAALLVREPRRFPRARALANRTICVKDRSEADIGISEYFQAAGLAFTRVPAETLDAAATSFDHKTCDALAADLSELGMLRAARKGSSSVKLLPELLSKEPLAMLSHSDDRQFTEIVRWTVNALIAAEELGVTQDMAAREPETASAPDASRLLGFDPGNGEALGLDESWARDAIAAVGHYGEIYARNIGGDSPYELPRGLNALVRDGGLMYALPMR